MAVCWFTSPHLRSERKHAETGFGQLATRSTAKNNPKNIEAALYVSTRGETGSRRGDKGSSGGGLEAAAHRVLWGRLERKASSGKTRPPAPGSWFGRRRMGQLRLVAPSAQTETTPFCTRLSCDSRPRDGSADVVWESERERVREHEGG